MNMRHLSIETLKELLRRFEIERAVAIQVQDITSSITLKDHAIMDIRYLQDKIDLVDMELRRRIHVN